MYTNILIPTDGSPIAEQGVTHALRLAKALSARATAVVVTEPFFEISLTEEMRAAITSTVDEINAAAETAAQKRLQAVATQATKSGVNCETVHVADGSTPADGILATAKERGCDLIAMASHGFHGVQRLMLGSQAFDVATRARIPVLIVRARFPQPDQAPREGGKNAAVGEAVYSRILISTDGSTVAQKAVDQGLALAKRLRASVTFVVASGFASGLNLEGLLTVGILTRRAEVIRATEKAAEAVLRRCAEKAAAEGLVHELVHVRNKVAADAILETTVKNQCDLIVMGSHGYRGLDRLMIGSQAYGVLGRAMVPVLIVR